MLIVYFYPSRSVNWLLFAQLEEFNWLPRAKVRKQINHSDGKKFI